ncbi:MAG: hypothetical protein H0W76_15460 [Pyrinomonadaceae bacterium]|nr:hypothetical protein [Pyrinomonadaceae bacterium]
MTKLQRSRFLNLRRFSIFSAAVFALALCSAFASAQQEFANDEFALELPSVTWRATARREGTHQHTEFVNGDRNDGFLRVRKEIVDAGVTASNLSDRDKENLSFSRPGYVEGKSDSFSGRLSGVTMSYEYTAGGKPMAGRVYYLQADNRTVYTLHFTGQRDKLLRIRNQTDVIARSFRLK